MGYLYPRCHLFWQPRDCLLWCLPHPARWEQPPDPEQLQPLWGSGSWWGVRTAPSSLCWFCSPTEAQVQLQRLWEAGEGKRTAEGNSAHSFTSALWHLLPQQSSFPWLKKDSSISLCSSWFLFSASSHAHSECLSFILPGSAPQSAKTLSLGPRKELVRK